MSSAALKSAITPLRRGAHCADAGVTLALHKVGFLAYGDEFVGAVVERYNRRLVDYNLVVVDYNRIGGAKVDCYFFC